MARRISRRQFLMVGVGVTFSALSACAPATPAGPAEKPVETPKPVSEPVKLELWAFVNTHARWFRSMAEDYKKDVNPNFELDVKEIAYTEMHDKLLVAHQTGVGAPDFGDVEQGRFGGFLKGQIGFVDLTEWLKAGGYLEKLVASREALYTWQGKVYGVEHALCPVVLYYRADVFSEAGFDSPIETWDDFVAAGKTLAKDDVKVWALGQWEVLLRQRGGDLFDADGNVTVDSDLAVETLEWELELRDRHGIADEPPGGSVYNPSWYGAVKEGKYLCHVSADWYAGFFEDNVPELSGKWRAMPLPVWERGGRRTSCLGGTGLTISKTSKHINEAWKFMEYSMLSVEGNVRRFLMTRLFPPFKPAWEDPRLHQAVEYFGGQDLGALFADVGAEIPAQYQHPYRPEFYSIWSGKYWRDVLDGKKPAAQALKECADELRKMIEEEL